MIINESLKHQSKATVEFTKDLSLRDNIDFIKDVCSNISDVKVIDDKSYKVVVKFNKQLSSSDKVGFENSGFIKSCKWDNLTESADESTMIDQSNSYNVASQISLNIKGEYDAIEGYDKLIPWLKDDEESIEIIRSIISEEKKHVNQLNTILKKYDKQIVAED